jgi:GxxExxY protein
MNVMNRMNGIANENSALTERIIGAAYLISNGLGCGFLEKVYENALALDLAEMGHAVEQQRTVEVLWHGKIVGTYQPDMIVDGKVLVELKASRAIDRVHWAQCMNYLRATGLGVGLLLNFGLPRLEIRRISLH